MCALFWENELIKDVCDTCHDSRIKEFFLKKIEFWGIFIKKIYTSQEDVSCFFGCQYWSFLAAEVTDSNEFYCLWIFKFIMTPKKVNKTWTLGRKKSRA